MNSHFATIYKEDLQYISKCILDYPDIETGGDFFGFWNNLGLPVIFYVTGPGQNSYRHSTFFKQDLDFLLGVGEFVSTNFGLHHIGSWHSHHKLSLALPSSHDCNTMVKAIKNNNLDKFFMILGNITPKEQTIVNGFLFDKITQTNYSQTQWNVLNTQNVISKAINNKLKDSLRYIPRTKKAKLHDLKLYPSKQNNVFTLDFKPESWLASQRGKEELKEIFKWFEGSFKEAKMYVTQWDDLELRAEDIKITFGCDFPNTAPKIEILDKLITTEKGSFTYKDTDGILQYLRTKIDFYQTTND